MWSCKELNKISTSSGHSHDLGVIVSLRFHSEIEMAACLPDMFMVQGQLREEQIDAGLYSDSY